TKEAPPSPAGLFYKSGDGELDQGSRSHCCKKLFFAAPARGLPLLSTALGSQASRLHFFTKLAFAAPASGLPFLSMALLSHVSWAPALATAKAETTAARNSRFILSVSLVDQKENEEGNFYLLRLNGA